MEPLNLPCTVLAQNDCRFTAATQCNSQQQTSCLVVGHRPVPKLLCVHQQHNGYVKCVNPKVKRFYFRFSPNFFVKTRKLPAKTQGKSSGIYGRSFLPNICNVSVIFQQNFKALLQVHCRSFAPSLKRRPITLYLLSSTSVLYRASSFLF